MSFLTTRIIQKIYQMLILIQKLLFLTLFIFLAQIFLFIVGGFRWVRTRASNQNRKNQIIISANQTITNFSKLLLLWGVQLCLLYSEIYHRDDPRGIFHAIFYEHIHGGTNSRKDVGLLEELLNGKRFSWHDLFESGCFLSCRFFMHINIYFRMFLNVFSIPFLNNFIMLM